MKVYLHCDEPECTVVAEYDQQTVVRDAVQVKSFLSAGRRKTGGRIPNAVTASDCVVYELETKRKLDQGALLSKTVSPGSDLCIEFKPLSSPAPATKGSKTPAADEVESGLLEKEDSIANFLETAATLLSCNQHRHGIQILEKLCELDLEPILLAKIQRMLVDALIKIHSFKRAATLLKSILRHDDGWEWCLKLAEIHLMQRKFEKGARLYQVLLERTDVPTSSAVFDSVYVGLGACLYYTGQKAFGADLILNAIGRNDCNFSALYYYCNILLENDKELEAFRLALKMLVLNSASKQSKEMIGKCLGCSRITLKTVMEFTQRSASVVAYLGLILKELGEIPKSIEFYRAAVDMDPGSASFALNLAHTVEASGDYPEALQVIRRFFNANQNLEIGGFRISPVLYALDHSALQPSGIREFAPSVDKLLNPPPLSETELDCLACILAAGKLAFMTQNFDLLRSLQPFVELVRRGRELQRTSIRNENAYFSTAQQLLNFLPEQISSLSDRIYVVGDSHSLSPAYHNVKYKGKDHFLVPCLATGCKIWHLRDGSNFYPKVNFWNVVDQVPNGSVVVLVLGEIDCREGFLEAVEKFLYDTPEDAMKVAIGIYNKVIEKLVDRELEVFVHPVPPVLNETRSIVLKMNELLEKGLHKHRKVHWMDFGSHLLQQSPNDVDDLAVKERYGLDGIHLNPLYIELWNLST